jgi:hypothetical protein
VKGYSWIEVPETPVTNEEISGLPIFDMDKYLREEKERLTRRLAYMTYGPGRPAAHKFHDEDDEEIRTWRLERRKIIERLRQVSGRSID